MVKKKVNLLEHLPKEVELHHHLILEEVKVPHLNHQHLRNHQLQRHQQYLKV